MLRRLAMLLLMLPADLSAQSIPERPVSLLAAFGLEYGEAEYGPGLGVGARFAAYRGSWLAIRLDLSYDAFGRVGTYATFCPVPGCPSSTGDRVKILSGGAHLAFLRHSGFAWTAGTGVYHLFETPYDGSYTRPGWNFGFTTSMDRSVYFDMRYHGLIGPRRTTRGFTLFALGIRL